MSQVSCLSLTPSGSCQDTSAFPRLPTQAIHGPEPPKSYLPLPLHSAPEGPVCHPAAILDARWVQRHQDSVPQFLVSWDGSSHDTWEFNNDLARLYPDFNLEDKVPADGGGIVMAQGEDSPECHTTSSPNDTQGGPTRKSSRLKKKAWKLLELDEYEGEQDNKMDHEHV